MPRQRPEQKRRSKYGNVPTYLVGSVLMTDKAAAQKLAAELDVKVVRFASQAEAKRDAELLLQEKAGEIRNIQRQPKFDLNVNNCRVCRYIGDWQYEEPIGVILRDADGLHAKFWQTVVEDRKGALTKEFKIKWALAKALHPEIEWRLS